MRSKEFMKKVYRNFGDFVRVATSRELQYLILDGKYTSDFNYRMKQLTEDLRNKRKVSVDFIVFFNTHGEISIINEELLGSYVADRYKVEMTNHYRISDLNHIVKLVVNSGPRAQKDFVYISFSILYLIFKEIYKEIRYKKEVGNLYIELFNIPKQEGHHLPLTICSLLVCEDICRYLGINIDLRDIIKS